MLDVIIGTFISLTTLDWWITSGLLLGASYMLFYYVWRESVVRRRVWILRRMPWLTPERQRTVEQLNALPRQLFKSLTDTSVEKLPLLIPLVATILFIGAGQFTFDQTAEPSSGLGLTLVTIGFVTTWLTAFIEGRQTLTANSTDEIVHQPIDNFELATFFRQAPWRGFLLTIAMIAIVFSANQARDLDSNLWAALAWMLAIVSYLTTFATSSWDNWLLAKARRSWVSITLAIGSIGSGIALRFYRLDLPAVGMEQDAANFGVSVLRFLRGERLYFFGGQWFFGVSAVYTYLQAGAVTLFGPTEFGLGFISAVIGGLNLVFIFLLMHRWFGPGLATITTILLAVAPHHLYYSRTGENNLVVPFFMTTTLYFLYSGLQTKRLRDYALAGVSYGIGLWWDYNNKSVQMYPILLAILLYWGLTRHLRWQVNGQPLGIALLGTIIVLLPVWSILAKLDGLWSDFSHGHALLTNLNQAQQLYSTNSLFLILAHQIERSVLGLTHINPNIFSAPWRMLDSLTAVFFFVGLAYSLYRWKDIRYGTPLVWWLAGLQGSIWSSTPPLSHRLVIILIPTYILAAVGMDKVLSLLSTNLNWKQPIYVATLTTLILGGISYANLSFYFDPRNYPLTWWDVADAGKAIKSYQSNHDVYFLGMPSTFAVGHGTIRWYSELASDQAIDVADAEDIAPFKQPIKRPLAFIAIPINYNDLDKIENLYPGGVSREWLDKIHNSGVYLRSYEITVQQANILLGH